VVNNTNSHRILQSFSFIMRYWSNLHLWQGDASRYCTRSRQPLWISP